MAQGIVVSAANRAAMQYTFRLKASALGDQHEKRCLIWFSSLGLLLYLDDIIAVTEEDHGAPLAILREGFRGLLAGDSSRGLPKMDGWSMLFAPKLHGIMLLQLGAGMEGFMIKTGFYDKYAPSPLAQLHA